MLWFKNLMVYRLSRDVSLRAEEMEKQLAAYTFSPCGSQDMAKTGWVPPMGSQSDALTHASSTGQIIVCARKEEKILPTPVVKQALEAKIFKLEAEQGRKLKKTEKDSLKDEVLHSLLPRAFSRFSQTMMWIDTVNGLIMVDCASAKKAEDTLALLRKSLGSLPVVPLTLENPIELTLTEWVRSQLAHYPRLVLMGDFNVAPDDRDTFDPIGLADTIHHTPEERAHFQQLLALGLHDSFRLFEQPEKSFSWWDYRMLGFQRNQGLRIDHILLSGTLAGRCRAAGIDRAPRRLERPSDHAPVWAVMD